MCFIATIIRQKKDDNLLYPIVKVLAEEQNTNDKGSGAYCFNFRDKKTFWDRQMFIGAKTVADNIQEYDVCNYHFRLATIGKADVSNVHFWRRGNWLFAHNGTITRFGDANKADSLDYFEKLIEAHFIRSNGFVDYEGITEFTNKTLFWGRFVLINAITNRMYFFGDWHTYLINRSYLMIASSTVSFDNVVNCFGINFEVSGEIEVLEAEIDGVHSFDNKNGFIQIADTFKDTYATSSYYPENTRSEFEDDYGGWKKPNTEVIIHGRGTPDDESPANPEIDDEDYKKEVAQITLEFNTKMAELTNLGFTDSVLAQIDLLEEGFGYALMELEEEYAVKKRKLPV